MIRWTLPLAWACLVGVCPASFGCAVGPDAPAGKITLPGRFAEIDPGKAAAGTLEGETPADFAFWRELGDPALSDLVEGALARSPDVARATAKLRESRAVSGAAWAALFPELRGGVGYERLRFSTETPLLSEFHASQLPGFIPDFNDYKASLQVAYELDVWGKNRRARESALHELQGDVERRRSIGLTLAGEVTLAYIDYRTLEKRRAISVQTLGARNAALGIARDRVQGGLGTELDVSRADVEAANSEATLADLDRQLTLAEHRLSVLVGAAPGALRERLSAPHGALSPFAVPVVLPAQLLGRRPDLRELSARLWAATARVGQAKADLFPQLVLQGEIGVEAVQPSKLFHSAAGYWTAGPSLQIPLFDWGRRAANWTAAEERADQALHDLEKQVLVSLQEVEDALSSLREDARRRQALLRAAIAGRRSRALAQETFQGGLATQLEVIDAQRTEFQAEDALAEADGQALRNAVRLAKALGGGVQAAEHLMPSPEPPDKD
jgi:NodT family efflux transporter outer membrane factor (OMF) lipoprotein